MQLSPAAFNRFFNHMGQDVLWRKADVCPCKNPHSGASDPKCPHCGGKGQMWAAAHEGVVAVTGTKVQKQWAQHGTYESGDSVVSIGSDSPLYAMGQADRVTLLNATEQFSLSLVRGAPTERVTGRVELVDRVFWLDEQKNVVEGELPAVSESGTLEWGDGAPPAGKQYTVSGRRFLEFFCWGNFPSNRNMHHGAQLPRLVVLRRFDLWGRGGN